MSDDMTGEPGDGASDVDPRYDRAFQRGFDGEVRTAPRGQAALRRTAAVNPPQRTAPESPVQRYPAQPAEASTTAAPASPPSMFAPEYAIGGAAVPAVGASITPTIGAATTASVPAATPRELARNPFTIALAALAALLILGGLIWAYEGFATIVKNGGTRNEVEFWAAQTMSFGAPLAVIGGLAVAAVLLVLFGRSWQRSRG